MVSLSLVKVYLYRLKRNRQSLIAFLILFILLINILLKLRQISIEMGEPVSIGLMAFIFTDETVIFATTCSLLLLFSDLPFHDSWQQFLIYRTGRRVWLIAQWLYILLISLAFCLIVLISTILLINSQLSWSTDWGRLLPTFSFYPDIIQEYNLLINLIGTNMSQISVYHSLMQSFFFYFSLAFFSGILICFFNLMKAGWGLFVYSILIFMQVSTAFFPGYWAYYISPLSWLNTNSLSNNPIATIPGIRYATYFLWGLILFFIIGMGLKVKYDKELLS